MKNEETLAEKIYFNKPGLIPRIKAMVIDSVIIVGLMLLVSSILNLLAIESGTIRGAALVLIFLYEPILVTFGGTIGQRIMGLRVRDFSAYEDNKQKQSINFFSSLIRYTTKLVLGIISLLIIHSDNYGQAIHDKVGNSVMTFE